MDSPFLLSVNRADAAPLYVGGRQRRTGHFKLPVAGRVVVGLEGIAGDFIGNPKHHGGADQAVYLYSQADNQWWESLLGKPVAPGFFGENLTLDTWWSEPRVGDWLRIGELLLELSGPRTPCATLEARAGIKGLSRDFVRAERCGAYARVLQPGSVQAGDRCELIRTQADHPSVVEVFRYWHAKGDDAGFLQAALASPLAARIADPFRSRLARCQPAQLI
jgi:MOSC domain-containing protein YiiM